jgi:hypothetical protein
MRRFLLGIAAIAATLAAAPAQPSERGVITALYENDVFGGRDGNYTNGVKLAYVAPLDKHDRLARKIYDMFWSRGEAVTFRASWGLGQSMFTPDDISVSAPLVGQRPYAGWLYGFYGFSAEENHRAYTNVEIELGVVGESARAEWVQKYVHQLIDGQEPRGWDNQLKDELGIDITVERAWRLNPSLRDGPIEFDATPDIGFSVGNVRTEAFAGMTLRLGTDLKSTGLPMRVRPSLAGSGNFANTKGWSWSAFAGVYGRGVAHNIFLDGNTFRDSLSVPRKTWIADAQGGVAVRIRSVQVSYTYVLRGEEYHGQHGNERFGAVCLSVHL